MKNKKWKAIGAAAVLVLAFVLGAVAPGRADAAPRSNVWSAGDNTNKVLKDGTFVIAKPQETTENVTLALVEESTTVINTAAYLVVTSSGGIVTLINTPTVSTTTAAGIALATGKIITIIGTSDTDAVVLQDDDTEAGSQLELGANSRTLGLNDIIVLKWRATASAGGPAGQDGRWLEVSYTNLD